MRVLREHELLEHAHMYTFLLVCLPPYVLAIHHLRQVATTPTLPTCFKYFASPPHFKISPLPTFHLFFLFHNLTASPVPTCFHNCIYSQMCELFNVSPHV